MGNAITMRQISIDIVYCALCLSRISTVKNLAQKADHSPATVWSILYILVKA